MTLIACVTTAGVMSRNARRAEVGLHARHPRARTTPRPLENKSTPTSGTDPDLWLYRERTMGMLRRYLKTLSREQRAGKFWK